MPATQSEAFSSFLRGLSYQVVRQFSLLANIDHRVRLAQNNCISIKAFFECDMQLAREYMAERHPSVNYHLKLIEA